MKGIKFTFYLYCLLIFFGCRNTKTHINDVTCLREVNTEVSKRLKNELGQEYNSIKNHIKLIMRFYVNENGRADSIVFERSNLGEFGINEANLIKSLKRKRFICLREVYYSGQLKPDNVVINFNPKLVNKNPN